MRGLSLVAASGDHSSSRCAGLSPSRPLLLWSTGSRRAGSVIVAHGPSCSAACGIFPDQGSNPCPLHWQADSQPLRHQGSPIVLLLSRSVKLLEGKGSVLHHSYLLLAASPSGEVDGSLTWLPDRLHDVDQCTEWWLRQVRKNQDSSTRQEHMQ